MYASSAANTPSFGYTFHHSNQWNGPVPTSGEVIDNLQRLVTAEQLESAIRLSTAIVDARKNDVGKWELQSNESVVCDQTGETEEFDAILVCTGFLGRQKTPPEGITSSYRGELYLPYAFEPEQLRNRAVTVVGSGSTALEMVLLALQQSAEKVSLVVRPGIVFYDISQRSVSQFCIRSNPLMFFLPRLRGGKPAAACMGLTGALADKRLTVYEGWIPSAGARELTLGDGTSIEADVVVWCTGWYSDVPQWTNLYPNDPTLVVASCQRCLNTGGFGYGTSTAHAKALHAALTCGFENGFEASGSGCDCAQQELQYTRHILLSLAIYLVRQRRGLGALIDLLRYGAIDNVERFRRRDEPLFAKLVSFVNAPFGL